MAPSAAPANSPGGQPSAAAESQVFALVLGTIISRLRQQRQMTQEQLASSAGLSQPVVSRIEAGKMPDAYQYGRIAASLGTTVQALEQQVHEAMESTRRAAEAVSKLFKNWDDMIAVVGVLGLLGLIAFAVGGLLGGGAKPKV